jgi:hypothetical protein
MGESRGTCLDPAWHGPDTSTQRGSLSFCVAVLALASLCFGCGHVESPPLPLHSLTEGIRASPGLPEVVVHFFKDMRAGAEPNQAGIRYLESRGSGSGFTGKPLLVSPPDSAVTVIARAFARGLAARGFSVVDRTAIPTPGEREDGQAREGEAQERVSRFTTSPYSGPRVYPVPGRRQADG